ncbi:uncharacterized protein LOC141903065 isoform X2 [Tubulanus polymorphus]|uniref:uncharacterized protein LOC141903065 isoform X2 n=1 Tax=Tubulanus polymorphus TaxID=672921 RepID=UPI003DA5BF24
MASFNVRLYRDGLQTAWGFRLQGGKDFNQPLTIQRVFTGSPAEGELQRGDIISAIDNYDTTSLSHKEAQDIIKKSGGQLLLSVRRGQSPVKGPQSPPVMPGGFRSVRPPQTQSYGGGPCFGIDYTARGGGGYQPPQGGHMMDRVQQSLDNALMNQEEEFDFKPVSEMRKNFQSSQPADRYRYPRNRHHQPPPSHMSQEAQRHVPQQAPAHYPQSVAFQPQQQYHPPGPSHAQHQYPTGPSYAYQPPGPSHAQHQYPTGPSHAQHQYPTGPSHAQQHYQPASRPAQQFTPQRQTPGTARTPVQSSGKRWKPPSSAGFGPPVEFGWTPSKAPHRPGYQPPQPEPEPDLHVVRPVNAPVDFTHRGGGLGVVVEPGTPAWAGSLRSANSGNAWPAGSTTHATLNMGATDSPTRVTGEEGKEELDMKKSYVYRMLQEEEQAKKRRPHASHHSYMGGGDPHAHQHQHIQTNVGVPEPDYGTSDF